MRSWPKPVRLFYLGPFFRYDRPQAGRWRQFHQVGFEVLGSSAPVTDAQAIYMCHVFLQELGLEDYTVKINSLGEAADRKAYIKLLKDHYRRNKSKMSQWAKERLQRTPCACLTRRRRKIFSWLILHHACLISPLMHRGSTSNWYCGPSMNSTCRTT